MSKIFKINFSFYGEMQGIGSKAFNKLTAQYKFNGGVELEEELNIYSTFYRQYDQQIGRFSGIDILSEQSIGFSTYSFGFNNPAFFNDPMGDLPSASAPPAFQNVQALFDYILLNGINSFSNEFTFYQAWMGGYHNMDQLVMSTRWISLDKFRVEWNAFTSFSSLSTTLNATALGLDLSDLTALQVTEKGFRYAAASASKYSAAKMFLQGAKTVSNISKGIAAVNGALSFLEGISNPDGWQKHNTIDVITTTASIMFPGFGLVFGILDVGSQIFTGKSISDKIEYAIEH